MLHGGVWSLYGLPVVLGDDELIITQMKYEMKYEKK